LKPIPTTLSSDYSRSNKLNPKKSQTVSDNNKSDVMVNKTNFLNVDKGSDTNHAKVSLRDNNKSDVKDNKTKTLNVDKGSDTNYPNALFVTGRMDPRSMSIKEMLEELNEINPNDLIFPMSNLIGMEKKELIDKLIETREYWYKISPRERPNYDSTDSLKTSMPNDNNIVVLLDDDDDIDQDDLVDSNKTSTTETIIEISSDDDTEEDTEEDGLTTRCGFTLPNLTTVVSTSSTSKVIRPEHVKIGWDYYENNQSDILAALTQATAIAATIPVNEVIGLTHYFVETDHGIFAIILTLPFDRYSKLVQGQEAYVYHTYGDLYCKKGVTGLYNWKKRFDDQQYYNKVFFSKEDVIPDPWIGVSNKLSCIEVTKLDGHGCGRERMDYIQMRLDYIHMALTRRTRAPVHTVLISITPLKIHLLHTQQYRM
jgi:hypothetical protein